MERCLTGTGSRLVKSNAGGEFPPYIEMILPKLPASRLRLLSAAGRNFSSGMSVHLEQSLLREASLELGNIHFELERRMQTRKNFTVILMVVGLILAGCTTTKTQGVSLSGASWFLTSLEAEPALPGALVTIEFSDGRINGSDGCNSYGGSLALKGGKISVGNDIISTMMACAPDAIMQQAAAFYDALKQAATYKADGQRLTLLDAGGKTLATFTRQSGGSSGTATPAAASDTAVPVTVAPVTPLPSVAPSIAQALPDADYPVEGTSTGKAQLKDGVFEESIAPGSASKISVQLGAQQAFGDLNGDGSQDAAVTLVVDSGGSGTFTYLAPVLNEQGTAVPVASTLLGDRIVVKSLVIQSGSVVVVILTRQADQPMSAEPTTEVTRTFQLRGKALIEVLNQ
jgi:heat shock protein HslJ